MIITPYDYMKMNHWQNEWMLKFESLEQILKTNNNMRKIFFKHSYS